MDDTVTPKHRTVLVVGPSGAGKTTICKKLVAMHPERFAEVVSHTTRTQGGGEVNGVDYHYITIEEFKRMADNNEFVETATHGHNKHYGLSRAELASIQASGKIPLVVVNAEGMTTLNSPQNKKAVNPINIFVSAPLDTVTERLQTRSDSGERVMTPGQINERLSMYVGEMQFYYDHRDQFVAHVFTPKHHTITSTTAMFLKAIDSAM